ncbi:hypothetical protein [Helicobacter pullorum]|uniref:hypothetical protein n=1 Tax=Helicobacter pullorum TaxID=35818 RepID=UPI00241EEEF3|nr:hypothetical protein [Helicobacter pullorum]
MSNAIELREEDLRSVLFNFEEALEKISLLKEELPKIESKLKEILEDSKEMVTLEEFRKKYFEDDSEDNNVKCFACSLNDFVCETLDVFLIKRCLLK